MSKTVCAPWCWILWGLLGLVAAVLGIIFGLGLLPVQGSTQGPTIIAPTQPETNITTPETEPVTPITQPVIPITSPEAQYINWIDPVPTDKVPVYTTVETPIQTPATEQFIDPVPIEPIASFIPATPIAKITRIETIPLPVTVPVVRAHRTSPTPLP